MKSFSPSAPQQSDSFERLLTEASSFADLIHLSEGTHPTELLQRMTSYKPTTRLLQENVQALIADATRGEPNKVLPQCRQLALPHPMDAEWRFTDCTARVLLDAAVATTQPGDIVLLMGVPSV